VLPPHSKEGKTLENNTHDDGGGGGSGNHSAVRWGESQARGVELHA
jgi:hypothetical protein